LTLIINHESIAVLRGDFLTSEARPGLPKLFFYFQSKVLLLINLLLLGLNFVGLSFALTQTFGLRVNFDISLRFFTVALGTSLLFMVEQIEVFQVVISDLLQAPEVRADRVVPSAISHFLHVQLQAR